MMAFYITVFLALLFLYGFLLMQKMRIIGTSSLEEFFLAGRSLGWFINFLTFSATLFSAFTLVGMPGFFYTHGIGSWAFIAFSDTFMALVIPLVGYRIYKISKERGYITPAQIVGDRFGRVALLLVVSVEFVFLLPYMSIQAIGIGKLMESATSGSIPYLVGVIVALILIFLYIEAGGMRTIAITDAILGLVLLSGAYILVIFFVAKHFGSLGQLFQRVAEHEPELLSIPGPKGLFTYKILWSFFIMIVAMPVTQFQLTQRYMTARSTEVLKRVMIATAVFATVVLIPPLLLGLGGKVIWPNLKSGDLVLGKVLSELPPILAAFGVIAVFSAALSTIDSQLLILSSLFTRDLMQLEDRERGIKYSRFITIFLLLVIFFLSLKPPKLIVELSILSFAGTLQILPTMLGALFMRKVRKESAWLSIMLGILVLMILKYTKLRWLSLGFHPALPALFIASLAFLIINLTKK